MAEKRSKSILSGLKNMLHLDSGKSSGPAPKSAAPARKKPAAPAAEKKPAPAKQSAKPQPAAAPAGDTAAAQEAAPDAKTNKVKSQPWYRHRQRW